MKKPTVFIQNSVYYSVSTIHQRVAKYQSLSGLGPGFLSLFFGLTSITLERLSVDQFTLDRPLMSLKTSFLSRAVAPILLSLYFSLVCSASAQVPVPDKLASAHPSPSSASNCSCPSPSSLEQAFDSSALIFVGRVEEKRINPLRKNDEEVRFSVTRKLKGFEEIQSKSVLIYTPKENPPGKIGDCRFDFSLNGEYVVFAYGSPAHLKTSTCTRTGTLEKSLMDVQRIVRMYATE